MRPQVGEHCVKDTKEEWQMVGGVRAMAMNLVLGQLICIPTRLDSSELPGAGTQMEQRWRCHPSN